MKVNSALSEDVVVKKLIEGPLISVHGGVFKFDRGDCENIMGTVTEV